MTDTTTTLTCKECGLTYRASLLPHKCAEWTKGRSTEPVQCPGSCGIETPHWASFHSEQPRPTKTGDTEAGEASRAIDRARRSAERLADQGDSEFAPRAAERERDESDSLKSLSALLKDPSYMALPRAHQIAIRHAHWNATTLPNNEFSLSWQDTKVLLDANAVLVEQRDRLLASVRKFVNAYAGNKSSRLGNGQARRSLDEFQELIITIEQSAKNAGEEI